MKLIFILIISIGCIFVFFLTDGNKATDGLYIPTVFKLQQALCDAGYPVEVDGWVGDETITAWDSFCADRMAAKFITGEEK